jgi:dTDP-4-amino-4,6-dideoxygalactose transaminase
MWDIKAGDDVIVTPRSFIASASCVALLGARPVFADVDRDSGNMTAETIAKVLTPQTRAIIPVHLGGWPCAMDPIMALADQHRLKVLEDCAQAHGARYNGRAIGAIGDAGSFSFCQDKIITTTGEGGLLATNDEELWERAWSFKDHGKTWDAVYVRQHGPGFRWVHDRFGTNYRMTEVQAAVGRAQLRKLDRWVEQRRRNARVFAQRLSKLSCLRVPEVPSGSEHAYYRFYAYLRPDAVRSGWTRDRLVAAITERGVPCFAGSCSEMYLEQAFAPTSWRPAAPLPIAAELGATSLAFLVHPTLNDSHIHRMCDAVEDVVRQALA